VLASKLPNSVPSVTIDRQCGSSQQAIHFAAQAVLSGTQDVVIAAGVESMSRVPMFSAINLAAQAGLGTGPVSPRIAEKYHVTEFSQFIGAQMIADKYGLTRDIMDRFALQSHQRAAAATKSGGFEREILPIRIATPDGPALHTVDEGIRFDAEHRLGQASIRRRHAERGQRQPDRRWLRRGTGGERGGAEAA
jgi:acetyl-CoA C-acetyltransferase